MTSANEVIDRWVEKFAAAMADSDDAVVGMLAADAIWRDCLAFTWNITTQAGPDDIQTMLQATRSQTQAANWRRDGDAQTDAAGWTGCWLRFDSAAGAGRAHVRLRGGQIWTLMTCLTDLRDHPWAEGRNRPRGFDYGGDWGDLRRKQHLALGVGAQPDVVIIGGGQAGMGLGARLQALGVSYLIVDSHPRPGDCWRGRYEALKLHDPVWYDHMPYIDFPAGWPVYTPKDRMADWLEMYARVMDLNYWPNTRAEKAHRDGEKWSVQVNYGGEARMLSPKHIVFATGMSGYPRIPDFDGAASFMGGFIHSSEYRDGSAYEGKRAVVIGANTSAHDIAKDLVDKGAAEVTMIQRSSTMIASAESVARIFLGPMYSEDALAKGISTEDADFTAMTWPWALMPDRARLIAKAMEQHDAALLDRLRARGFRLDRAEDGAGIPLKSARRGGGFYVDFGASDMIADGRIGLVSGAGISRVEPDAILLNNGQQVECDLIVCATGFGPMNQFVADICGRDVADAVGRVWGLGSGLDGDPGPWEGELRAMWKPTGVENLWMHGGNLAQSRHYSRFLALQLKARLSGMSTPVFARQQVHHKF